MITLPGVTSRRNSKQKFKYVKLAAISNDRCMPVIVSITSQRVFTFFFGDVEDKLLLNNGMYADETNDSQRFGHATLIFFFHCIFSCARYTHTLKPYFAIWNRVMTSFN